MIAGARTQQQQQQQQQQRASPQPSLHSGAATQHSSGSSRSSGSGRSSPRLPQSTRSNSTTGTPDGWVGDAASAGAGAAGAGGGGAAAGFGATGDSISRRGDTLSVITGDGRGSATLQADVMSLALAATWQCRPDGMLQPVWLADRDAGSGSGSGSGARGAAGGCSQLPMVWLQSGCEPARLMAWHSGPLLFLLLLEPGAPTAASCAAVTAGLAEVLAAPAAALCASLAAELPAKNLWHVQGLRYLYEDHLAGAVRCAACCLACDTYVCMCGRERGRGGGGLLCAAVGACMLACDMRRPRHTATIHTQQGVTAAQGVHAGTLLPAPGSRGEAGHGAGGHCRR
jgi:hypothetical protein